MVGRPLVVSFRAFGPSRNDGRFLARGSAAVDGIGGARDITCLVGGEERHEGSDLGGKPEPARRYSLNDPLIWDGRIAGIAALDDRTQHAAIDHAGADAVDAHIGRGAFERGTLGEADYRMLARGIGRDV